MTLGDFMDILGRLHKLTPAQRRAVAEVLAEPDAVEASIKSRREYTEKEATELNETASYWPSYTAHRRSIRVANLASKFGRTEKAIRYQITSRLK